MIGFLFDENLPGWWLRAVLQREPQLRLWEVGDGYAPPKQSVDPVLLHWCELNDVALLTDNRTSMPIHLADHVAARRHVPGIFTVSPKESLIILATSLVYVVGASLPDEFRDQISYLPRIVL